MHPASKPIRSRERLPRGQDLAPWRRLLQRLAPSPRRRSRRRLGHDLPPEAWGGIHLPPAARRLAHLGLMALLLRLLLWALAAPTFELSTFEVHGLRTLTAREVVVQSGLEGENVFRARPERAVARLKELPSVRTARVRLKVPGYAFIEVVEREPLVLWRAGERTYGVDAEGILIPASGAWEGALTIVSREERTPRLGERVDVDLLRASLAVQLRLPETRTLEVAPGEGLILRTPQGWPVYLGLADGLEFKLAVLEALLEQLAAEGLEADFLDLRLPTHPIVAH